MVVALSSPGEIWSHTYPLYTSLFSDLQLALNEHIVSVVNEGSHVERWLKRAVELSLLMVNQNLAVVYDE